MAKKQQPESDPKATSMAMQPPHRLAFSAVVSSKPPISGSSAPKRCVPSLSNVSAQFKDLVSTVFRRRLVEDEEEDSKGPELEICEESEEDAEEGAEEKKSESSGQKGGEGKARLEKTLATLNKCIEVAYNNIPGSPEFHKLLADIERSCLNNEPLLTNLHSQDESKGTIKIKTFKTLTQKNTQMTGK